MIVLSPGPRAPEEQPRVEPAGGAEDAAALERSLGLHELLQIVVATGLLGLLLSCGPGLLLLPLAAWPGALSGLALYAHLSRGRTRLRQALVAARARRAPTLRVCACGRRRGDRSAA